MKTKHTPLCAVAAVSLLAALVAGCGSDNAPGPRASIDRVIVAGDSLADVGAFGVKATVQNSADPVAGFPIYPQIIAKNFGIDSQCNFYVATDSSGNFADNPVDGCTNFAVGGARIINSASRGGAASAYAVPTQLARAASVNGGHWDASDLLLIDGGGNDIADLITAYLGTSSGAPAAVGAYRSFLLQQLDAAVVDPLLQQGAVGFGQAAGLYMQTLADTYYNAIKAEALDRGATRVAVLNIPDVTLTPRFRMVLGSIAQTSPAQAEALTAAIRQWEGAFNGRLQSLVAGDKRVALVDFYADLTDQVTYAPQYGATNATTAACPITGIDGSGLPTYSFPACTSDALDASAPEGLSAGWWHTWTFSDGFHPSPFGHRLLASSISRALARAGWL